MHFVLGFAGDDERVRLCACLCVCVVCSEYVCVCVCMDNISLAVSLCVCVYMCARCVVVLCFLMDDGFCQISVLYPLTIKGQI